jgi:hypothetical protein
MVRGKADLATLPIMATMLGFLALLAAGAPMGHRHVREITPTPPPAAVDGLGSNVRIEYSVAYSKSAELWRGVDVCINPCRGEKHLTHAQCDASCDGPCGTKHARTLRPQCQHIDFLGLKKPLETIKAGANQLENASADILDAINKALETDAATHSVKVSRDHFNTSPCSSIDRYFKYEAFDIDLTFTVYRYTRDGDGNIVKGEAASGKALHVAQAIYPTDTSRLSKPYVRCACEIVKAPFEAEEDDETPDPKKEESGYQGILKVEDGGQEYAVTTKLADQMHVAVTVADINTCSFTAENPFDHPITLSIGPGTSLACADGMHQTMCVMSRIRMPLQPFHWAQVQVPIDGPTTPSGEAELLESIGVPGNGRVTCLEMTKDAPDPSVKYTIQQCGSSNVLNLAKLYNSERFHTVIGQMRMWIVTDHASLAEMKKHLLPQPSESTYVLALHDVEMVGGVTLSLAPFASLLEPRLLIGPHVSPEIAAWFVRDLTDADPAGLCEWLSSNRDAWAPLWSKDGLPHAANVANALCNSANPAVAAAGADFLLKTVPPEQRVTFAAAGGLRIALQPLSGSGAAAAAVAMDIAEAYRAPECVPALDDVGAALPQAIRDRAAALRKALSS